MTRRAAGLVGLTALAVALILVIALTTDRSPSGSATPTSEVSDEPTAEPSTPALPDPAKAAVQARALAKLAKQAKAQARIVRLFKQGGCWQAEAPAGAEPTHALVTLPGEQPAMVAADVGYGIWLDGDPGQLHAFCP
ncbi:MAG: hypothetical protein QOD98_228 [Nocardioidaceae bacterium]|nr:hypothetical protein [Nocardioidaceae bacterium]